jgi:hypothetical protein
MNLVVRSKISALITISILILSNIALAYQHDQYYPNEDQTYDQFEDDGYFDEYDRPERFQDDYREEFGRDSIRIEEEYRDDEFGGRDFNRGPDFGPEYQNKEEMLFGRLFHLIEDDINEFEMLQLCGTPDKIADIVIEKVTGRIGDISNACSEIENHELECKERIERDCGQMGKPDLRYAQDEREKKEMMAWSCPPNKEAIVDLCIENSGEWIDEKLNYVEEDCEFEWKRFGGANDPSCNSRDEQCDESNFIDQCLQRYKPYEEQYEDNYYDDDNNNRPKDSYSCPDVTAPSCNNGYLEQDYDSNGCIRSYRCVEFQQDQCGDYFDPVCGDDGISYHNDCEAQKAGVGYSFGECGSQCPYSDEETAKMEDQCNAEGGQPEIITDNGCVADVKCHFKAADESNQVTGQVTGISGAFTYEEAKRECNFEWDNQKRFCSDNKDYCDKGQYVDSCKKRQKQNIEFEIENNQRQCERDANVQIRHAERECSRIDAERDRCYEDGSRQCGRTAGLAGDCRDTMTEANFRAFIMKEAQKHCKFVPFIKDKENIKNLERMEIVLAVYDSVTEEEIKKLSSVIEGLDQKFELEGKIIFQGIVDPTRFNEIKKLNFVVNAKLNAPRSSDVSNVKKTQIISRINPQRVVEKLLEIRDTKISSEYKYLVEDKASDLLEVSDDIDQLEQKEGEKGIGYKLKLFLGLAKGIEEDEIKGLERSKERLETSINTLSKLVATVPDDIAKAILKTQVEDLELQKEDINDLIEQKRKRSKGLLQLFGLIG